MHTYHQSDALHGESVIVTPLPAVGGEQGRLDSSYDPGTLSGERSVMDLASDVEALEAWRRNLARLRDNQKT